MSNRVITFVTLLIAFTINASAQFLTLGGEVVEVIDGKTIVVASATGRVKVELQFIEVPEPEQQLHQTVKTHLEKMLMGKVVEYKPSVLHSDRTIGRVTHNGVDVSEQLLRDGAAWHVPLAVNTQSAPEKKIYADAETAAKNEKRGIWSIAGLKPPWEFRAQRQAEHANQNTDQRAAPQAKKPGYWGDKNPAMGDVGALSHGYNAATRSGYVTSSRFLVEQSPEDKAAGSYMTLDVTYWYREDVKKGRNGIFVVTLHSYAKSPRFQRNNDLVLMDTGNVVMGRAKRTVSNSGDTLVETLTYTVSRGHLDRLVNGNSMLRIQNHLLIPRSFAYSILHNMLQASGKTQLASSKKSKR